MKPKRLNRRAIQTGFILLCTFILIIGVKAQVVTDGLVSYYTLDNKDIAGDTVKDIVGGMDGTIINQPKSIKGHLGDALDFTPELKRAARAELENLVASGKLKYRETVAQGLKSAPQAFIGMLQGENLGKQLVKLT